MPFRPLILHPSSRGTPHSPPTSSPAHSTFIIHHSSFFLALFLAACDSSTPAFHGRYGHQTRSPGTPITGFTFPLPTQPSPLLLPIADALASSSINTVIFRHSPLVSFGATQYAAFYDPHSRVVLARRTRGSGPWETRTTDLTGNTQDAHNTISLGIDGTGILHLAWDHHGSNLNYVQSQAPGSLELTPKLPMDGNRETQVTYPEFYSLPGGADALAGPPAGARPSDLLFLYRVGASGNGDLVLKRYRTATQKWETLAQNLVAGEGRQNAYPEFAVGPDGTLHLAWTWRRTPDVSTNHDICYAQSKDAGRTWTDSAGKKLALPITAAAAEVAVKIPEKSELINQTTLAGDAAGHPYIATYFRPAGSAVPQYQVVYHDGKNWHTVQVGERKTPFTLAGAGTRRIPISRPLILVDTPNGVARVMVVIRDEERQDRVTVVSTDDVVGGGNGGGDGGGKGGVKWVYNDLTTEGWGSWEPAFDSTLWARDHILDLFVQKTDQLDGNDASARTLPPTKAYVLECKP